MTSLRAGAVLLSLWSGLNLLVAAAVTALVALGRPPPALAFVLADAELARTDGRLLRVVESQALLANPCIAALCGLVLALVWKGVVAGQRWALGALAATLVPLQAFGFVSDASLGHSNLGANVLSSLALAAGLALCARGLYGTQLARH